MGCNALERVLYRKLKLLLISTISSLDAFFFSLYLAFKYKMYLRLLLHKYLFSSFFLCIYRKCVSTGSPSFNN